LVLILKCIYPSIFLLFDWSSLVLSFKYYLFLFLKCLLACRLSLLKLYSFTSLGSCSHCSLACFLPQPILNVLYQTMVYDFSIHSNLDLFGRNFGVPFKSVPCPIGVPIIL
jgi:hypothetical protein